MKNLSNYSSAEDIGTVHWFRTLASNIKHIGEFIEKNPTNYNNEEYGSIIKNAVIDLIEWQESGKPLRNELYKDIISKQKTSNSRKYRIEEKSYKNDKKEFYPQFSEDGENWNSFKDFTTRVIRNTVCETYNLAIEIVNEDKEKFPVETRIHEIE